MLGDEGGYPWNPYEEIVVAHEVSLSVEYVVPNRGRPDLNIFRYIFPPVNAY
jgi:hypothetical protein